MNAINSILILCFSLISGVEKFMIASREYAEPATQAPIISMGNIFPSLNIVIIVPDKETSKDKFNKK